MVKMYIAVSGDTIEELINEVNEQMNINKGVPQGGIVIQRSSLIQAMLVEIKTNDDEVLPEQILLTDIKILAVERLTVYEDPFSQSMRICYEYNGIKETVLVDNYDSDDVVHSLTRVRDHLVAIAT